MIFFKTQGRIESVRPLGRSKRTQNKVTDLGVQGLAVSEIGEVGGLEGEPDGKAASGISISEV